MMLAFTTNNRVLRIMVCVLALSLLVAGCAAQPSASESSATTTRPESQPNATTTTVPTIFETEPVETKPPIVEPSEYITIVSPAKNAEGLVFEPLDISKGYCIDLNKDGVLEKISFVHSAEEFYDNYYLILNGQFTKVGISYEWGSKGPVIVDLDINDDYYDLIFDYGDQEFWETSILYFNGKKLILRGELSDDLIVYEYEMEMRPVDLVKGFLDGQGNITTIGFSSLGHTVNFDKKWQVAANGLIEELPVQGYQQLYTYNRDKDQKEYNFVVTLKMDLPLYSSPFDAKTSMVAKTGETTQLIQGDDTWFQVRTQGGQLGWFRMGTGGYYNVLVGHRAIYAMDVFDGITIYNLD